MFINEDITPDDDFTYIVNDLIFTSAGELMEVIVEKSEVEADVEVDDVE